MLDLDNLTGEKGAPLNGHLSLSLGKESPYMFSKKFNPLNTNTPLKGTLSMTPSGSVLTGFDSTGSM